MGKLLLIYLFAICGFLNIYAQDDIYNQSGSNSAVGTQCYFFKTKQDFLNNTNIDSAVFEIRRKSEFYFQINRFYDKPSAKIIKTLYCIISPIDTLVNLSLYNGGSGFSKIIILDSFHIVFKPIDDSYIIGFGILGGIVGVGVGALTHNIILNTNLKPYTPIIVNQNSGKVMLLTKPQLKFNLKRLDDEKILRDFNDEKEYTLAVLLKYFQYFIANRDKIKK